MQHKRYEFWWIVGEKHTPAPNCDSWQLGEIDWFVITFWPLRKMKGKHCLMRGVAQIHLLRPLSAGYNWTISNGHLMKIVRCFWKHRPAWKMNWGSMPVQNFYLPRLLKRSQCISFVVGGGWGVWERTLHVGLSIVGRYNPTWGLMAERLHLCQFLLHMFLQEVATFAKNAGLFIVLNWE